MDEPDSLSSYRILLTGASGWLGRSLAPVLREAGHHVVGLDVAPGPDTKVLGSVAERALLRRVFDDEGIDAVIHTAALHKPDVVRRPRSAFVEVNELGTLHLLELAAEAGHARFVFTSTTSLMIRADVRAGASVEAFWIDEDFAPLIPRNIYGATKWAAEHLCRLVHEAFGMEVVILRTSRFFPEEDDTLTAPSGPNLKANEFLHRRLTVRDAARAHLRALEAPPGLGCSVFIVSAPPPFRREDARSLVEDAPAVVRRLYPDVDALYAQRGWVLPERIDRVYDSTRSERQLNFRYETRFEHVLHALREGTALPFRHDPTYVSPKQQGSDHQTKGSPGSRLPSARGAGEEDT